ncbi:MAG TPA: C4-type zinc ribbon domain-containing protein [Flavobacteriaceae bacterium]|nr:C4-type zinc ribbon domain-containing protein [Flavobacteriaceae bacterium]
MAKQVELSVEEKLRLLYDLQLIDSRIDEIKNLRGELPLEVRDMEDEIEGLTIRIEKLKADLETTEDAIKGKQNLIEEARALIKKYKTQQDNVRNNREYNSLSKEIEYQELEIQLAEKQIKELKAQIAHKTEVITQSEERLTDRKAHLDHKKSELDGILSETQKEEEVLMAEAQKYRSQLEERLVVAYDRIRTKVKNGLAIVTIERGASGGSFFAIPPQMQMEIAARKRITTDEHSGRILVDTELANEEKEKMEKFFSKL